MGYDIWLEMADGSTVDPAFGDTHPLLSEDGMAGTVAVTEVGYTRIGNYTSNVSPIWARCICAVSGWATRLADIKGKSSGDVVAMLEGAVNWGVAHIDELREMNPTNGWGNAEGAVTYLWDIQRLCEQNDGIVRISR